MSDDDAIRAFLKEFDVLVHEYISKGVYPVFMYSIVIADKDGMKATSIGGRSTEREKARMKNRMIHDIIADG